MHITAPASHTSDPPRKRTGGGDIPGKDSEEERMMEDYGPIELDASYLACEEERDKENLTIDPTSPRGEVRGAAPAVAMQHLRRQAAMLQNQGMPSKRAAIDQSQAGT